MNKLTFGKFEGKQISEVPFNYLKWMVENKTFLYKLAEKEIKRRLKIK